MCLVLSLLVKVGLSCFSVVAVEAWTDVGNNELTPGDCHGSNSSVLSKVDSCGFVNGQFVSHLMLLSEQVIITSNSDFLHHI
jgi:hypothetical protein